MIMVNDYNNPSNVYQLPLVYCFKSFEKDYEKNKKMLL